jgi:hypothetical protein
VVAAAAAVGIQLVPYGRDHAAPPGRTSVSWPSAEAAGLFRDACADCHTHETRWPWYAQVAPMSWLVQRDVDLGRDEWNLSVEVDDLDDAAEEVEEGGMPPRAYQLAHPGARLSADERRTLAAALRALDGRGSGRDD